MKKMQYNMLKSAMILLVPFLFISCSNASKAKLGLRSSGPDSTTVSPRQNLQVPPILTELPQPKDNKE